MIYTVKFDIVLRDDEILTEAQVKRVIQSHLNNSCIEIYDFELLDCNNK